MRLLAFDTSSSQCSAAILDGEDIIDRSFVTARAHAQQLLPLCEALLNEAGFGLSELDTIAFGRGPGSFTGLRIAASMAQGLAFATDLPVVPVSSLQALAQGAHRLGGCDKALVAMDARMGEVYWGAFSIKDSRMQAISEELVIAPTEVPQLEGDDWTAVGYGWQSYKEGLMSQYANRVHSLYDTLDPEAYDIAVLAKDLYQQGDTVQAEEALPVYLRNQVTHGAAHG